MAFIIGLAILLLIFAAAAWAARTPETKGNGDNRSSAMRYGGHA